MNSNAVLYYAIERLKLLPEHKREQAVLFISQFVDLIAITKDFTDNHTETCQEYSRLEDDYQDLYEKYIKLKNARSTA